MTRSNKSELDAFLREVADAAAAADHALVPLSDDLEPIAPSPELRDRMLLAARADDRLGHYAPRIAAELDIDETSARALIARIDDPNAWFELLPGISLLPAAGGPRVDRALRGFVRVRAGVEFPLHEHYGEESVMIMQGYYADSVTGEVFGPGDTPVQAEKSQHSFTVLADGPDLLGLVVAHGGLRAQGQDFLP